jgi:25S rRNA (uracil2634-N3)-methyltransferase
MVKSKKISLKAALSSAQARFKKIKQAERAVEQAFDQKVNRGGGTKSKAKAKTRNPRRRSSTIPFKVSDNILLIGEGNFSFTVALLQHPPTPLEHFPPANITATTYDTEGECYAKYPDAEPYVRMLREKGAQVLFGVDATKLEKTPALKGRTFDRVVWNFPHAGEHAPPNCMASTDGRKDTQGKGISDQDRNILSNQVLILGFLRSAAKFLVRGPVPRIQPSRKRKRPLNDDDDDDDDDHRYTDEDNDHVVSADGRARGTILITLRNVPPYTAWCATYHVCL